MVSPFQASLKASIILYFNNNGNTRGNNSFFHFHPTIQSSFGLLPCLSDVPASYPLLLFQFLPRILPRLTGYSAFSRSSFFVFFSRFLIALLGFFLYLFFVFLLAHPPLSILHRPSSPLFSLPSSVSSFCCLILLMSLSSYSASHFLLQPP